MMSLAAVISVVLVLVIMFVVISAVEQDWRTGALVIGFACVGFALVIGIVGFSIWLANLLTTG